MNMRLLLPTLAIVVGPLVVQAQQPADEEKPAAARRASSIAGMKVYSAEGQEAGGVKDLVVGMEKGEIRYAALSMGGFLGLGEKLLAVPWRSLEVKKDADGNAYLTVNIPKQRLEQSSGFDQESWPSMADSNLMVDAGESDEAPDAESVQYAFRIENLKQMQVVNLEGEKLGQVKDLVIDTQSGRVRYAALAFTGFLGLDEKLLAIPWDRFGVDLKSDEKRLVLDVSEAKLKDAPGFSAMRWPSVADPQWRAEIDKYYGREKE